MRAEFKINHFRDNFKVNFIVLNQNETFNYINLTYVENFNKKHHTALGVWNIIYKKQ